MKNWDAKQSTFIYIKYHVSILNLTLSINKSLIEKAKRYAKGNNQILSQIYWVVLRKSYFENPELGDPELDSIRGIIKLPKDFDLKKETRNLRIKKHG